MTTEDNNSIKSTLKDQDFKQKTNISFLFTLEIYRVIMASFIVLLIPQKCGIRLCSFDDNMNTTSNLKKITMYFNVITFFFFMILYTIELKREHLMIDTLDVNKHKATNKESVKEALEQLPKEKKIKIWNYDDYYKKSAMVCILFYVTNLGLSIKVLYDFYYDNKTVTVFLTNFLFMYTKLSEVFSIVNTPKNIFYSSYLKNKVQFNDIDKDALPEPKEESISIVKNDINNEDNTNNKGDNSIIV